MANLPEKNIVTVGKVTSIPSNTSVFINANGEFVQASINDVVKASNVVSDATLNAVKEAIDNQFSAHSGKSILANTSGGYATDFTAYGRSEQKQYSGKNLLKLNSSTQTISGITLVYDSEKGTITANGTSTALIQAQYSSSNTYEANTDYIVSGGKTTNSSVYIQANYWSASGNQLGAVSSSAVPERTFTNGAEGIMILYIVIPSGITLNNVVFEPMIRKATVTDGTFEPYVGGTASPNPTYPQEILSNGHRGYYDGELLNGYYNSADGNYVYQASGRICSKNTIPCKSGDVVKIVLENNVSNMYICYYNESGYISMLYGTENTNSIEKTMPDGATRFTFWAVNSGMTVDTVGHICVTINGKYALIQKHVNKNFLTPNKTKATWNGIDYTPILNNRGNVEYYSISGTRTDATYYNIYDGVELPNGIEAGKTYKIGCHSTNTGVTLSINERVNGNYVQTVNTTTEAEWTPKANSTYTIIRINVNTSSAISDVRVYPMIRLAEVTDDTYVPHEHQTTYIPIAEPLRGVGEVKDSIKKVDGLYGEGRKVKEVVFDGSDDEKWGISYNRPLISVADIKKTDEPISKCTHFKNRSYSTTVNEFFNYRDGSLYFVVDTTLQSLSAWKEWLANNPIKVVYELAEETFTPFADQTPFYQMKTFDGVTLISSDAEMEVEVPTSKAGGVASIGYAKGNLAEIEMQNIKTKLTELQTAVVSA